MIEIIIVICVILALLIWMILEWYCVSNVTLLRKWFNKDTCNKLLEVPQTKATQMETLPTINANSAKDISTNWQKVIPKVSVELVTTLKKNNYSTTVSIKKDNYNIITPNLTIKEKIYYRLGVNGNIDTTRIENIIDSILESINDPIIKQNLKNENPIYLVGASTRDFHEFKIFENSKTTDGTRNLLDVKGFATNKPIPGFISIDFNFCKYDNEYPESIVFHEFAHTLHESGFSQQQKKRLTSLYDQYNVKTNKYNINSYAFSSENEFFAEMAQIYCQMTYRLDVTGNININILRYELPDMFLFLASIFNINNSNKMLLSFCDLCNNHKLCCRDDTPDCISWAAKGECKANHNYMHKRCRKSCSMC